LALEPGQSVAAVTQQAPGIRVIVDGGEFVEMVPGQPERAMAPKSCACLTLNCGPVRRRIK
jgi:hypothetical protein